MHHVTIPRRHFTSKGRWWGDQCIIRTKSPFQYFFCCHPCTTTWFPSSKSYPELILSFLSLVNSFLLSTIHLSYFILYLNFHFLCNYFPYSRWRIFASYCSAISLMFVANKLLFILFIISFHETFVSLIISFFFFYLFFVVVLGLNPGSCAS
jgi:hypothetical protein